LIPVLNSLDQIEAWRTLADRSGRPLPAALQVDSGMARMGMAPAEVDRLAADPSLLEGIETVLVMSHLACADEPASSVNGEQLRRFKALRRKLPSAPASLASASGIFLGKAFHFDLARPGVALYGVNPTPAKPNPMRPVITLEAKVIQTRDVPKGEGVGYGHAFRARKAIRAATISLGYADGWQRRATGKAFFNGVPLPFLGRVSMDSIVIDISSLPEGAIHTGDLVELIGPNQSVDDVAKLSGTIGYEVLTSLGDRFHRVYLGGGAE
jgi:alanine racemase